ncbi:MAG: hypothetical protein K6F33_02065, partial [Bacteroidales bacterium]|nr:hypothetical protein [Bacteroidales bacterium]
YIDINCLDVMPGNPQYVIAGGRSGMYEVLVGFDIIDADSGRTVGRIASVDDSTLNILFCLDDGDDEVLGGGDETAVVEAEENVKSLQPLASRQ